MVAPTGLGLYSIAPTNQNLKPSSNIYNTFSKKNGPREETPTADGLCLRQILGAPPPAWADHVRTPPIGQQKNLFPKKVFAELFPDELSSQVQQKFKKIFRGEFQCRHLRGREFKRNSKFFS